MEQTQRPYLATVHFVLDQNSLDKDKIYLNAFLIEKGQDDQHLKGHWNASLLKSDCLDLINLNLLRNNKNEIEFDDVNFYC